MNSSIALLVMTKNEERRLPKLFESVLGFADLAVVLDTGSSDGTLQWVREQKFFPAFVNEAPFVDFETSRNLLFECAKGKADCFLLLDADMELKFDVDPAEVKSTLTDNVTGYLLRHADPVEYWVARLVRGNADWKFKGVTHEYLVGGGASLPRLTGVSIIHHQHYDAHKFERDLRLLSADIARDPDDYRTIFYLGNTLRDMGKRDAAIRFYVMRASMGGWDEEAYIAMYEAARLAEDPNAMMKAFKSRPTRAEPAQWLALYYAKEGDPEKAALWEKVRASIPIPPNDVLFVIKKAYGPQ
jgi:glycosyltransferase involved in cell wall biosynthesis